MNVDDEANVLKWARLGRQYYFGELSVRLESCGKDILFHRRLAQARCESGRCGHFQQPAFWSWEQDLKGFDLSVISPGSE